MTYMIKICALLILVTALLGCGDGGTPVVPEASGEPDPSVQPMSRSSPNDAEVTTKGSVDTP